MHPRHAILCLIAALVISLSVACRGDTRSKGSLILATTTSTQDSGLLDVLVPRFVEGRQVAVPPGALKPGPGDVELSMVVENVLDLVERREIVGRVGDVRVHVGLPAASETPQRGSLVIVHADGFFELA